MTINCKGRLIDFTTPLIMGIINVTPDSFYENSRTITSSDLLQKVENMVEDGVDIIDVGGMSTRPGADFVSQEEELDRLLPAVEKIHLAFPDLIVSVDTFRSVVAEQAIAAGASMINDISAGSLDPRIMDVAVRQDTPYIMMHMVGAPKTMQNAPIYDNVVMDISKFFVEKINIAKNAGIKDIILDPGFGFGKNLQHNYQILNKFEVFQLFDLPILAGISRKSMIYKPLDITPQEALNGTTALHTILLQKQANILRVHDVKAAKECVVLYKLLNESTSV